MGKTDYDAIVIGGGSPVSTAPARWQRAVFESPSSSASWSEAVLVLRQHPVQDPAAAGRGRHRHRRYSATHTRDQVVG